MISRRNALWLIPLLLFLTFPLWRIPVAAFLAPRGGFDGGTPHGIVKKHDFTMESVIILQNEKGKETATIRADKAHSSPTPDEFILEEVDADIFNEEGNLTNVIAKTGNYNTATKLLKLIDDVVITNTTDGYIMNTGLLHYNSKKRRMHCPGKTVLKGDGITIDGTSFSHDINSGTSTVGGRVYCTIEGVTGM